jgi:Arc/MetJ-type ribon-helix-helix transcriptional regulator
MQVQNLTEITTVRLTPEHRKATRELEAKYRSTSEIIRQALALFLAAELRASKQNASKQ